MLSEIIGNEAVKERIVSLLKAGRLPHAVMIEGQRGTGRLTLAHAIAKALVCDSGNACGNCLNCKQAANRINPDVLVYYPGKPTLFSVDDVRKINDDAMIKPNQAARKVMILCDCEKMNAAAQNAFLKTLEEPPGRVQFILITQNRKELLETIRSRCSIFTLVPPDFSKGLDYLCSKGYAEENAKQALLESEGNIGSAISLLKGTQNTLELDVKELLQLALEDKTMELLSALSTLERDRNKIVLLLEQMARYAAKAIRDKATKGSSDCNISMQGLLNLQQVILEADKSAQQNANKGLLLTVLCEKIVRAAQM